MTYKDCSCRKFNGACRYDFNQSPLTGLNGADRFGVMGLAHLKVSANTREFVDFGLSRSRDHFLSCIRCPIISQCQFLEMHSKRSIRIRPIPACLHRRPIHAGWAAHYATNVRHGVRVATGMEGTVGQADWKIANGQRSKPRGESRPQLL